MELLYTPLALKFNDLAFLQKVREVSQQLNIEPDWLMAVMRSESGINPKAVNRQTGDSSDPYVRAAYRATGLIQFMPTTARGLGTSTQAIYNMNGVQQMEYVKMYFWPYRNRIKQPEDLYIATFYPAALGQPDSYKIGGSEVARQNPGFDLNKNGQITLGEFRHYIRTRTFADLKKKLV